MELIDTHCHIHAAQNEASGDDPTRTLWLKMGNADPDAMIRTAAEQGVTNLICVGTDLGDSRLAVEFVKRRDNCRASVGVHPHEAGRYARDEQAKKEFSALVTMPKVVAVGECGLDYYYKHSTKEDQQEILRFQLRLALEHDLPLVFHVREAFEDFWRVLDEFKPVRGVIHSFTDTEEVLAEALRRGFYIGLNGIMTFTKHAAQLEMAKKVPIERLMLETDAPYLTPKPYRGTVCEPKHMRMTSEFLANLRGENLEELAAATTCNAKEFFGI